MAFKFNPFTSNFDIDNTDDSFSYYKIVDGTLKTVPINTEMFVTDEIFIQGDSELDILGEVTVWSLDDITSANLKTITADYTVTASDRIIVIDAASNNIILTLPLISGLELGHELKLVAFEQGTYSITINAGSTDDISGDSSVNFYKYEVLELNAITSTRWAG